MENIVAKVQNRENNLISAVVSVDKLVKAKGLWLIRVKRQESSNQTSFIKLRNQSTLLLTKTVYYVLKII